MHYLADSITKLCQGRKQWCEGWEGIPMYDCSGKEVVRIVVLECGYLSVCKKCNPPDFKFYLGKLDNKKCPHMVQC